MQQRSEGLAVKWRREHRANRRTNSGMFDEAVQRQVDEAVTEAALIEEEIERQRRSDGVNDGRPRGAELPRLL